MTREDIKRAIDLLDNLKGMIEDNQGNDYDFALRMAIKALELEPKADTWSLDDAREDFMSDVYNILDFLPTNNEANRIIDSFNRVTSGIEQESKTDLDKIREEIERTVKEEQKYDKKWAKGLRYAVKIIDKYRQEGEE